MSDLQARHRPSCIDMHMADVLVLLASPENLSVALLRYIIVHIIQLHYLVFEFAVALDLMDMPATR